MAFIQQSKKRTESGSLTPAAHALRKHNDDSKPLGFHPVLQMAQLDLKFFSPFS